jgi:NAD-dependent dihydropyrimidine dehydrogenase PreA subunit
MAKLDPIYKQLAAIMKLENSETMQKILAKLATPEQGRIILELPAPSEEIAKKLNLTKESVDKDIKHLVENGLVVLTKRGPKMCRSEGQLHDLMTNPKFDKELGSEFWALWRQMGAENREGTLKRKAERKTPGGRIIPRWKSIKDIPGILPFEDTREILKAHSPLAVVHCACKRVNEDRKCDIPDECCIIFGRTAEFNIKDRKCARELTIAEAQQLNDDMDKYPVVHLVPNVRDLSMLLCNCHVDCCDVMKPYLGPDGKTTAAFRPTHSPSRFVAVVDPKKCKGCKLCVAKRCQFDAAKMKFYPELGAERSYIDADMCMGCGLCVITCPTKARTMKLIRPPEHVPESLGSAFYSGENPGT